VIVISVIVATYKRKETLRLTLTRLGEQTYSADSYEVIVVDDGSDDGTGEMVESVASAVPYALRYLYHQNKGPGATQNRGILEARGEVIVLLADDVHADPGLLEHHARFHQAHPELSIAALGSVFQSPELPQTVFQRKWDPFRYFELKGKKELPYWKFWACNISAKRAFLLENGLFRELKGAAHEDVELGYRLSRKGLRILYHPRALAYHYHVETLQTAAKRGYERGCNWAFIEENVPDPQIYVKYHILNLRTLKYHYLTFKNLSKSSLPLSDRILPWLLFKQAVRAIVFNRLTVPGLWMRLLSKSENSRVLAALLPRYCYRGTVFYYFVKGCRDQAAARSRNGTHMGWSQISGT
jgi:glycosyltransferase involved in cell wall biosynthesis